MTATAVLAHVTHDEIVPVEYQNLLIQIGEDISRSEWAIGDTVNNLIEAHRAHGTKAPASTVQGAAARYCGKSTRSVRYYCDVAKRTPQKQRDTYPSLSFSHFAKCAEISPDSIEKRDEMLKWAADNQATVARLEAKFKDWVVGDEDVQVDNEGERLAGMVASFQRVFLNMIPKQKRQEAERILRELQNLI